MPDMRDLERSIKAGCEAHECVYPTCIASDGTLCRQHQRYLLAALAALDPPSDAVVEAVKQAIRDEPLEPADTFVERIARAAIRAAAIRGEQP